MQINPYLNFDGTCREAFELYSQVFGSTITMAMKASDSPEAMPLSPEEQERIMYIELPVGTGKLMGSDIFPSLGHSLTVGNNNYITLSVTSTEEVDRLFSALSVGGEVEMAPSQQFFGYFTSFADKYGVRWMIITGE